MPQSSRTVNDFLHPPAFIKIQKPQVSSSSSSSSSSSPDSCLLWPGSPPCMLAVLLGGGSGAAAGQAGHINHGRMHLCTTACI